MSLLPGEVELARRARAGDRDAFAALCERSRARLWRIAASVASGAEAEDLAQEAILRAWSSLASYRGDSPFEAWLCRIAVNAAHDWRRSAWHRRVLLAPWPGHREDAADEAVDGAVAERETMRRVRRAVAGLPQKQRVPIWLHYFEDFTVSEVARLERAPETTIRSRIQAGLRRLEGALGELLGDAHDDGLLRGAEREGCRA